jgi:hypothetical protein
MDHLEPLFQYRLGAITRKNVVGTRLTQGPSCDLIQVVKEPITQIYNSILQGLIPAEAVAALAGAVAVADPTMVEVVRLALQEAYGVAEFSFVCSKGSFEVTQKTLVLKLWTACVDHDGGFNACF